MRLYNIAITPFQYSWGTQASVVVGSLSTGDNRQIALPVLLPTEPNVTPHPEHWGLSKSRNGWAKLMADRDLSAGWIAYFSSYCKEPEPGRPNFISTDSMFESRILVVAYSQVRDPVTGEEWEESILLIKPDPHEDVRIRVEYSDGRVHTVYFVEGQVVKLLDSRPEEHPVSIRTLRMWSDT